jgi:ABC-2 type transport system permease protein
MKALAIAGNELRRMLRDRSNLFFVLLLPLLLVLFIGTGTVIGATVAVAGSGPLAEAVRSALDADGAFQEVIALDVDAAADAVARSAVTVAVIVTEHDVTATATATEAAGPGAVAETVLGPVVEVEVVARDASIASAVTAVVADELARRTAALDAARLGAVAIGADVASLLHVAERIAEAGQAAGTGAVRVTSVGGDPLAAEFQAMGRFDLGATSQLVLFTFLTAMVGAVGLIQTRELGVAGRIRSTATPLATLLAGQALGRIAVAVFQATYLVVATALLFGASWGDPLATAAVIVLFSMVAGGAGMLVGTVARNEAQAGGLGIGLGLGLGALGGSMVPLEVMPEALIRIARFTPHAWANSAFAEIVRRGGGIGDVLSELAVLAMFAAVMLGLAVVVLRRRLARG